MCNKSNINNSRNSSWMLAFPTDQEEAKVNEEEVADEVDLLDSFVYSTKVNEERGAEKLLLSINFFFSF